MERNRRRSVRIVESEAAASWDSFLDCYLSTSTRAAVDRFLAGLAALGRPSTTG